MSDHYFRELLKVKPGASKEEIKRAFHRLARQNHPDLFPEEQKEFQQLKMMALNEAYAYLINLPGEPAAAYTGPPRSEERVRTPPFGPPPLPEKAVGPLKEPGYAYYKQGFIRFSRALHGIESLSLRISVQSSFERFTGSLRLLRESYRYFNRVVEEYPDSIWSRDAEIKLRRIERFSELYKKILANLKVRGN